jgi:transposase InsO family protein
LQRRGFVTPQPQKQPKSSFVRFCAAMPNELWQADITHWHLADGTDIEILNVLDDHSRFLVASDARRVFKATDVVTSFRGAAAAQGLPASLLTDNGAVFTAGPRGGGRCAIEIECDSYGVRLRHSSPYHPQTCGKVERFHQTLKRFLRMQEPRSTLRGLQAQLDRFGSYYDEQRPHRAIGRRTPAEAYAARPKATPSGIAIPAHCRGSAGTGSTPAVGSRFATTAGYTTSRSVDVTLGSGC